MWTIYVLSGILTLFTLRTVSNGDIQHIQTGIGPIPELPNPFTTSEPTEVPSDPTDDPTSDPTYDPTLAPSHSPTAAPSIAPTLTPSLAPSLNPTFSPSDSPTMPSKAIIVNKTPSTQCVYTTMINANFSDVSECIDVAATNSDCDDASNVMWSAKYFSIWGCKCCTNNNASNYIPTDYWDIYSYQVISGKVHCTLVTTKQFAFRIQ